MAATKNILIVLKKVLYLTVITIIYDDTIEGNEKLDTLIYDDTVVEPKQVGESSRWDLSGIMDESNGEQDEIYGEEQCLETNQCPEWMLSYRSQMGS